jgi:acetolactate synthase-1/2/3 large subunit
MNVTVSELVVRFMERLGIVRVYGVPGSHILPVYDRLYDSKIKTVLTKHEQGAAFMAAGEARISGGIGACITTAGPGATNLVTGIANAYVDKLPVLAVTGETSTYLFGKGGLQESSGEGGMLDQNALFKGITRYHRIVERPDYLAQVLNQAARILLGPDSGPVLLSLPYNVQKEAVDPGILDRIDFDRRPICGRPEVAQLAGMIAASRTPVILAGYGCIAAGAQEALHKLSREFGIPVATSLKAKGAVPENGPLALGCLGVTSDRHAYRYIVDHADLMLVLGASFNERTSHLWNERLLVGKRLVQVDRQGAQLNKVFHADLAIEGDVGEVLDALNRELEQRGVGRKSVAQPDVANVEDGLNGKFGLIAYFYQVLASRFPASVQIVDDNIIFAQNYMKLGSGSRYVPNTGVSSLGHAIPAAIGARLANAVPTFAILGDGGFQMCGMELMTAVNYGVPLNVVLINNGSMGLIRKNQVQLYEGRFIDCDFVNPDFALLAQSFGIRHYRIENEAQVDQLFGSADLNDSINLIEIMLDKNAFPEYRSDR